jgi:DNA adenine methylase
LKRCNGESVKDGEKRVTGEYGSAQPFLRWSGGKRRSLEKLLKLRPAKFGTYHEPFVGGGCLFFALEAQSACLSDINPQVARTYRAIREDARQVARLLSGIPQNEKAFELLRQLDPASCNDAEAAARLIFLMKSCFNGVYRENRIGSFNTPWGGKVFKLPDLHSLLAVQSKLTSVKIDHSDFALVVDRSQKGDFAYLDPPYPQRRYRGEFGSHFADDDVNRLLDVCDQLDRQGVKVMLSYVVERRVATSLRSWRTAEVRPTRSVASNSRFRGEGRERIFMNY